MKYFISDVLALSRPPEGPVASYIVPFAEYEQPVDRAGYVGWFGRFRRKSFYSSDACRCGQS